MKFFKMVTLPPLKDQEPFSSEVINQADYSHPNDRTVGNKTGPLPKSS
jgi:hypothetical protein